MRRVLLIAILVVGCCGAMIARPLHAGERGLVINEDNSHFFLSRSAKDMTVAGLRAFVDQYAETGVSHLFLFPNAMRASFRSKTRDAIWELGEQEMPTGVGRRWMDNARLLNERGLDPYKVWIDRCREKGISPWLSMRMNDVHDVSNLKSYMHSTFWLQHPEYWRVPRGSSWIDRAFDYRIAEVREHNLAFVRELLERYDPDGIELDWMRFGYHIKPGHEEEGRAILTQFMRDVRALTSEWSKKRNHVIQLAARVPTHPDAAAGLCMDGVAWVREDLVDMLVVTPFWTTSDFDIPLELWRERLGEKANTVTLAAGLEHNVRAYPGGPAVPNDLASVRGFVTASLHRGADQIYLFNFMDSDTRPVDAMDYRTLLRDGADPAVAATKPRRFIICYRDTVPAGFSNGAQLPVESTQDARFEIYTGPVPAGGTVTLVAGLAKRPAVQDAVFDAQINGVTCKMLKDLDKPAHLPPLARFIRFDVPMDALAEGKNQIVIKQKGEGKTQRFDWIELRMAP